MVGAASDQRGLAAIYLFAFMVVLQQFKPLLGELGLLPVPLFLKHTSFRETPSVFMCDIRTDSSMQSGGQA